MTTRPYSLHAVWFGGARYYSDDLPSAFKFRANTLERAKLAIGRVREYGHAAVIVGPAGQRWIFDEGDWKEFHYSGDDA